MPKTCPHCKSSDLDVDPARGDTVCMGCGSVLEENAIVSEVLFSENADGSSSVVGQFVSTEGHNKPHFTGFRHGMSKESRQQTLDRGRREITEMAAQLHLNRHCVDTAYNFFKMAINKRLSRGRRIQHIVAACLYMTCRTEGTPHMLLDFSDVTEVNVFTLGKAFLVLAKELHIHLPVLDPCMYITRFAHRMDFGEKTHEVCMSAMRLVSRMKRDWIHTGRRPSGLCGAALLVAARLHGFTCNLNDVVRVVRIGNDTIRKRLTEFVMTPSSQLTINEFMNIDLEAESDPPAFTESRLKNKQQIENVAEIEEEIGRLSNKIDQEIINANTRLKPSSNPQHVEITPQSRSSSPTDLAEDPEIRVAANFVHSENPEVVASRLTSHPTVDHLQNPVISSSTSDCLTPSASTLGLSLTEEECFKSPVRPGGQKSQDDEGELDLTDIDDEEINNLILSEGESLIKARLWMAENGEFLKEMEIRAEKRRLEEEEREKTKPRKKRKVIPRKEYYSESRTAGEAIEKLLHRQKLSNKINYEALKKVTEEPEVNQSQTGSKFIESFLSLAKHDEKFKPQVGAEESVTIEEKMEVKEVLTKRRKRKIVEPCLNPDVKNEKEIETKVTIESGPVTMAEDEETYEEYGDEMSCLSATQLFQHSGHGAYGIDGYDGFEEYD